MSQELHKRSAGLPRLQLNTRYRVTGFGQGDEVSPRAPQDGMNSPRTNGRGEYELKQAEIAMFDSRSFRNSQKINIKPSSQIEAQRNYKDRSTISKYPNSENMLDFHQDQAQASQRQQGYAAGGPPDDDRRTSKVGVVTSKVSNRKSIRGIATSVNDGYAGSQFPMLK